MRNLESHFSVNPVDIDIQRSRFDRPFNHQFTTNVGTLVPFYCTEILPGDSVQMKTSKVIRTSTMLDPVMGTLVWDTYYFFVPMRLCWIHTKEFFGENTSGPWIPQSTYTIPQLTFTNEKCKIGSVADYMGIPQVTGSYKVSALPIRAYNIVYRDWFMSEALETPPNIYFGDSDTAYDDDDPTVGGSCYLANRLFDYFSSALPAPQRGSSVTIPLGGNITVSGSGSSVNVTAAAGTHSMGNILRFGWAQGTYKKVGVGDANSGDHYGELWMDEMASITPSLAHINYTNLVAQLPTMTADMQNATPISVNDLRLAFQIQKWYEKSALYGGRYIEMLKAQFGVTSPDARLQRSEYLGGNRVPISVHQVESTNGASTTYLGKLGAYGATSDYNSDFVHSFTEHGFLVGVCCARFKASYSDGLERMWSRKTMFDHYFPLLANIGNTAIMRKELWLAGDSSDDTDVWGYQEAWADYRYSPDRCSGLMRPGVTGSLASWNYADHYTSEPTLSESWLATDKSNVDRTLAVTSASAPQLICDIFCDSTWTRAMPLYSIPGLIDHH